jgi:hypothetical protein
MKSKRSRACVHIRVPMMQAGEKRRQPPILVIAEAPPSPLRAALVRSIPRRGSTAVPGSSEKCSAERTRALAVSHKRMAPNIKHQSGPTH